MLAAVAGLYDAADTKRFYITVLNYQLDQGVHLGSSQILIASSISSNPADGFLGPYAGIYLTSLHQNSAGERSLEPLLGSEK